jgi:hypothetical protein
MKITEVRTLAKKKGVNPVGKSKETLIRAIQAAEHNRDCFNRGESTRCGQPNCAWRVDGK